MTDQFSADGGTDARIARRTDLVCEAHPECDWPHTDTSGAECSGAGMPKAAQIDALVYQRDTARLEHQETRGTVAAWKAIVNQLADAIAPSRHTPEDRELWEREDGTLHVKALVNTVLNMRDVGEANERLKDDLAEALATITALSQQRDLYLADATQYAMWLKRDREELAEADAHVAALSALKTNLATMKAMELQRGGDGYSQGWQDAIAWTLKELAALRSDTGEK